MKQLASLVLTGSFVLILFDILASIISNNFQLSYSYFSIGSFIIYFFVGFFCAKNNGLRNAVLVAGLIGLVDSTIGWFISMKIGPSQANVELNFINITLTRISVIFIASLFGLIGALISRQL